MAQSTFDYIIQQLGEHDFSGRLSFHLYNEPMLHPHLDELVAQARSIVSKAWLVLYSNGDLLDDRSYRQLSKAGIDLFFITRHNQKKIKNRPFQSVRFPGEFRLSNRGGVMSEASAIRFPCLAPSEMLMIRHNGNVVLCHEDAASQEVVGRADVQSLEEIWQSEKMHRYRQLLALGNRREAGPLCAVCDNRLHPLPDTAI